MDTIPPNVGSEHHRYHRCKASHATTRQTLATSPPIRSVWLCILAQLDGLLRFPLGQRPITLRKAQGESGAAAGRAPDLDLAVMQLDGLLDDGQSQSGTAA